ncbi:hypothetical protein BGZ76_007586, partial [Entomortierella beljakovae]
MEALFPKPAHTLSEEDIANPITLLKYGLQYIVPSTINHPYVMIKNGTQEKSFQAALFTAFCGLLPTNMMSLFEVKAKGDEHMDLMVMKEKENWAAYELKVGAISEADFKPHLEQAKRYQIQYGMTIHLVNFYLAGQQTPAELTRIPDG